jgi:large subunit ribosomal protein L35
MLNPSVLQKEAEGGFFMPKMKSKKAASKRFSVLSSGRIKRSKCNKRHILTKKDRARKNKLKKTGYVHPSDVGLVMRCLPNG